MSARTLRRLSLVVLTGAFFALTPAALSDAPSINVPSGITTEATSSGGANVDYSSSATDTEDGTDPVNCSPSSGSLFPLGDTTVNCSSTDSVSDTATASFDVTVQDTTPPSFSNVPSGLTAEATSSSGATVDYSPTATDIVDGSDPVNCAPTSGSLFSIGSTTVNCTSTDNHNNTATVSFGVTVRDTTAPTISGVPSNITTNPTSSSGATVNYSLPTATDAVDGSDPVNCAPASGSLFPDGVTTVHCTSTDSHNNTASASFTVTVGSGGGGGGGAPSGLSGLPSNMTVEATGPNGAKVQYTSPTATNGGGTLTAACVPASGSTFPFGATTVTCVAGGAQGTFVITVVDTTPPRITGANDATVDVNAAAGATVNYSLPTATDLVSGPEPVNCAPARGSTFPLGVTVVHCTAKDAAGNTGEATLNVTVRDIVPPPPVTAFAATLNGTSAKLTWRLPKSADAVGIEIVRVPGPTVAQHSVFKLGLTSAFTNRRLKTRTSYIYTAYTVDRAGNLSRGVTAATGVLRGALLSPADGATLSSPPLLRWKPRAHADYYNVQLWLHGKKGDTKVLSIWPTASQLRLHSTWKYAGKHQRLAKGVYRWYVWPGIGPLAKAHYGALIGTGTFTITS